MWLGVAYYILTESEKEDKVVVEHPNFVWKLPKASFIVCLCFTTLFNFAETSDRKLEFVLTENTLLF